MTVLDLAIRGGTVVAQDGVRRADVGVADGRIVAVAAELDGSAREEIGAAGLHVLPGAVDAHVHLNDPGRADWEGFATGTHAAAAGGTTTVVDMPLNALPPTIDGAAFDAKRAAGEGAALVDFALWGGLVPGDVDRLDETAARGVVGFKAFMADSGVPEFATADDLTLYEGMRRAAALRLPVAVHAESDAITRGLAARAGREGRTGVRDYVRARPAIAEVEAIGRALLLAEETGCALHVVHVSTGRGVALVAEARARGVDATCETCPHYLVLDESDAERLGAVAKCAPSLRPAAEREALWLAVKGGGVAFVASDHSPAPPALKRSDDFFAVWGGIAGAQTLLGLLLHAATTSAASGSSGSRSSPRPRPRGACACAPRAASSRAPTPTSCSPTWTARPRSRPRPCTTGTPTAPTPAGRFAGASRARSSAAPPSSPTAASSRRPPAVSSSPSPHRRAHHDHRVDHRRALHVQGAARGGARAEDVRRLHEAPPLRAEGRPRALERRVDVDPARRVRCRGRLREPHEPPRARPDPALPGRLQRDRDPPALRRLPVREHRRPARRQPLPHGHRGQREPPRARRDDALGRCAGHRLRPRLT
jgi:allantoinase